MPLNVPNVGEAIALEALVNRTAPQNLNLRLYANNITPADTDTAVTYTENTFAGYAAIALAGASWNAYAANSISYSAQQTFTRSTTGAPETTYGYYLTQVTSGILVWSERDPSAPFTFATAGDNLKLTPAIGAD